MILYQVRNTSKIEHNSMRAMELFEGLLSEGLTLRLKVTGRSMNPFLKSGDVVSVKQSSITSLHSGDLILFRNTHGMPVLHRVIRTRSFVKRRAHGPDHGGCAFTARRPCGRRAAAREGVRRGKTLPKGKSPDNESGFHSVEGNRLSFRRHKTGAFSYTVDLRTIAWHPMPAALSDTNALRSLIPADPMIWPRTTCSL